MKKVSKTSEPSGYSPDRKHKSHQLITKKSLNLSATEQ